MLVAPDPKYSTSQPVDLTTDNVIYQHYLGYLPNVRKGVETGQSNGPFATYVDLGAKRNRLGPKRLCGAGR